MECWATIYIVLLATTLLVHPRCAPLEQKDKKKIRSPKIVTFKTIRVQT